MIFSQVISESMLWKSSLDVDSKFSERKKQLVSALEVFRSNTSTLANEISRDLPEFTVHDISHIDALWEIASTIAGPTITLNPVEAFIFGSAVLLHDLGMASAAYVEGVNSLDKGVEWEDTLELVLRRHFGRIPTDEERQAPPDEVKNIAIANRLRALHAIHAEVIPQIKWQTEEGDVYRLLEDQELLEDLGELIGRIAASHWWTIERVESELNIVVSPPTSYPAEWDIDVLKIACLLRSADAAHIDKRRAPGFLRALRKPEGISAEHWKFQNRLARPNIQNNQLVYNSTRVFTEKDVEAWWIAYDTLIMINKELQSVEKLLREHKDYLFEAKGVRGIESPQKLMNYIRVNGWIPLDARVHVSDLPKLVEKLGGESLYGRNPTAPIRELIANACDAIEASRKMGGLSGRNGKVIIRIGKDLDGSNWLEVEDNGIGMSSRTLSDKLLDFGSSYWDTDLLLQEHPGLYSSGFEPIGKFGIGFFSVFMFGDKIRVTSRSIHNGPDDTNVLSFSEGLNQRPILMKSKPFDKMRDPGTIVRIYLSEIEEKIDEMYKYVSFRSREELDISEKLQFICRKVAPCINADLFCEVDTSNIQILKANDWKTISEEELLLRLTGFGQNASENIKLEIDKYKDLIKPIYDENGEMLGRLCISGAELGRTENEISGMVTCGGLEMDRMWRLHGVLVGEVDSASRNSGKPIVSNELLSKWATDQAQVIRDKMNLFKHIELIECSSNILVLGGSTGDLPICEVDKGYLSYNEIKSIKWPNEVMFPIFRSRETSGVSYLKENIIFTLNGIPGIGSSKNWPIPFGEDSEKYSIEWLVRKGILESWEFDEAEISYYLENRRRLSEKITRETVVIGKSSAGLEITERVYVMKRDEVELLIKANH